MNRSIPRRLSGVAAVSLALGAASGAGAQGRLDDVHCAPTSTLQVTLTERFGVERRGSGLRSPDQMMELWADDAGDWALVARYASGQSCIVAMGGHWSGAQPQG